MAASVTLNLITGFNPRPRTGGDAKFYKVFPWLFMFQSTPPHGGRLGGVDGVILMEGFQSTPPHGGRLPLHVL